MAQKYTVSDGTNTLNLTVLSENTTAKWAERLESGRLTQVILSRPRPEVAPGVFADAFGVLWKDGVPVQDSPVPNAAAFSAYRFPTVSETFIQERTEAFQVPDDGSLRVCVYPEELFDRMAALAGKENLLSAAKTDPIFVHALAKAVCERLLQVMETSMQSAFDIFLLDGVLYEEVSEEFQREFLIPYFARIYAMAAAYGKGIAQKGQGMPVMAALGLDMLAE